MVVCNSELCILVVDPRLVGSGHDSWVWQHNPLCARLVAQLQPGEYPLGAQLRLVPGSAPSPGCPPEPLPSSQLRQRAGWWIVRSSAAPEMNNCGGIVRMSC
ncbi:uncharacterized protein LOC125942213 [Dermacentor silvarum]|uniref:uncharacterized protein LOC125942213 n=1 Tax=Dermacentor silvarum TaxID=543639 RepID=UPI002101A9E4|nr:uncharacterized protein LOC125942213 [Dermacentor silvarum]